MTQSRAPVIVAIVLLLLPLLYVGSYLALVVPTEWIVRPADNSDPYDYENWLPETYRFGNSFCRQFFWPLEQIDRKLRPGAWEVTGYAEYPREVCRTTILPLKSSFAAHLTSATRLTQSAGNSATLGF